MGVLNDLGQKVEGKLDQARGETNKQTGKGVKGGFQKVKGKLKEAAADFKLENDKDRAERDTR